MKTDKIAAKIANEIAKSRNNGLSSKIAHDVLVDKLTAGYIAEKKAALSKKVAIELSEKEKELIKKMAEGAKKQQILEQMKQDAYWSDPIHKKRFDEILNSQPEWTTVKGIKVLRINDSDVVGVPNKTRFDMIDFKNGKLLTQVKQSEVRQWLISYYWSH